MVELSSKSNARTAVHEKKKTQWPLEVLAVGFYLPPQYSLRASSKSILLINHKFPFLYLFSYQVETIIAKMILQLHLRLLNIR